MDPTIVLDETKDYTVMIMGDIDVIKGDQTMLTDLSDDGSYFKECMIVEDEEILRIEEVEEDIVFYSNLITCSIDLRDDGRFELTLSPTYERFIVFDSLKNAKITGVDVNARLIMACENDMELTNTTVSNLLFASAYFGSMTGNNIVVTGKMLLDSQNGNIDNLHDYNPEENTPNTTIDVKAMISKLRASDYKQVEGSLYEYDNSPKWREEPEINKIMHHKIFDKHYFVREAADVTTGNVILSGNYQMTNSEFITDFLGFGGNFTFANVNFTNLNLNGTLVTSNFDYVAKMNNVKIEMETACDYSSEAENTNIKALVATGLGYQSLKHCNVLIASINTDAVIEESFLWYLGGNTNEDSTYENISNTTVDTFNAISNGADFTFKDCRLNNFYFMQNPDAFTAEEIPTFTFDSTEFPGFVQNCFGLKLTPARFVLRNMMLPIEDTSFAVEETDPATGEKYVFFKFPSGMNPLVFDNITLPEGFTKLKFDITNYSTSNGVSVINCPDLDVDIHVLTNYSISSPDNGTYISVSADDPLFQYDKISISNVHHVLLDIKYENYSNFHNSSPNLQLTQPKINDGVVITINETTLGSDLILDHDNVFLYMSHCTSGNIHINTQNNPSLMKVLNVEDVEVPDSIVFYGGSYNKMANYGVTSNSVANVIFSNNNVPHVIDLSFNNSCASLSNLDAHSITLKCSSSEFSHGYNILPEEEIINNTRYSVNNLLCEDLILQVTGYMDIKSIDTNSITFKSFNSCGSMSNIKTAEMKADMKFYDSAFKLDNLYAKDISLMSNNSQIEYSKSSSDDYQFYDNFNFNILLSESSLSLSDFDVEQMTVDSRYNSTIVLSNMTINSLQGDVFFGQDDKMKIVPIDNTNTMTITNSVIKSMREFSDGNTDVLLHAAHINKNTGELVTNGIGIRTVNHGGLSMIDNNDYNRIVTSSLESNDWIHWQTPSTNSHAHFSDYVIHGPLSETFANSYTFGGSTNIEFVGNVLDYNTIVISQETLINNLDIDPTVNFVIIVDELNSLEELLYFYGADIPADRLEYLDGGSKDYLFDAVANNAVVISTVSIVDPQSYYAPSYESYKEYNSCSFVNNVLSCKNKLMDFADNDPVFQDLTLSKQAKIYNMALLVLPNKGKNANLKIALHSNNVRILLNDTQVDTLTIIPQSSQDEPCNIKVSGGKYQSINIDTSASTISPAAKKNSRIELSMLYFIGERTQSLIVHSELDVYLSLAPHRFIGETNSILVNYNIDDASTTEGRVNMHNYITNVEESLITNGYSVVIDTDEGETPRYKCDIIAHSLTLDVADTYVINETSNTISPTCMVSIIDQTAADTTLYLHKATDDNVIQTAVTGLFHYEDNVPIKYKYVGTNTGVASFFLDIEQPSSLIDTFIGSSYNSCSYVLDKHAETASLNLIGEFKDMEFGTIDIVGNAQISGYNFKAFSLSGANISKIRLPNLMTSINISLVSLDPRVSFLSFSPATRGDFSIESENMTGLLMANKSITAAKTANVKELNFTDRVMMSGHFETIQGYGETKTISVLIRTNMEVSLLLQLLIETYIHSGLSAPAIAGFVILGLAVLAGIVVGSIYISRFVKKRKQLSLSDSTVPLLPDSDDLSDIKQNTQGDGE